MRSGHGLGVCPAPPGKACLRAVGEDFSLETGRVTGPGGSTKAGPRAPWEGGTWSSSLVSALWDMGEAYPLSRPRVPFDCKGKGCWHVLPPPPPPSISKALPVGPSSPPDPPPLAGAGTYWLLHPTHRTPNSSRSQANDRPTLAGAPPPPRALTDRRPRRKPAPSPAPSPAARPPAPRKGRPARRAPRAPALKRICKP